MAINWETLEGTPARRRARKDADRSPRPTALAGRGARDAREDAAMEEDFLQGSERRRFSGRGWPWAPSSSDRDVLDVFAEAARTIRREEYARRTAAQCAELAARKLRHMQSVAMLDPETAVDRPAGWLADLVLDALRRHEMPVHICTLAAEISIDSRRVHQAMCRLAALGRARRVARSIYAAMD